jgi:hypothetical protein
MMETMGFKKYILPVGVVLVIFCVFSLMMYPLLHAEPKEVPIAIVSLDEGVAIGDREQNMGKAILAELTQVPQGQGKPMIAWTQVDSKDALDQKMADNEFYAAVIIPEDFTATAMASAQGGMPGPGANPGPGDPAPGPQSGPTDPGPGDPVPSNPSDDPTEQNPDTPTQQDPDPQTPEPGTGNPSGPAPGDIPPTSGESPVVSVIINQGKNPMVAQQMQVALTMALAQKGLSVDVTSINDQNVGTGIGAMMSGNVIVMPIFMMTAISSVLLALIFRPKRESGIGPRLANYAGQLGYGAIMACLISLASVGILTIAGGMTLPLIPLAIFLAIASFTVMTLFMGALDIGRPVGILTILTCFSLGMAVGMLAKEMLPAFWQSWVYPWIPQRSIGQGAGSILYLGADFLNPSTIRLIITGGVGLLLMIIASLLGKRKKVDQEEEMVMATPSAPMEPLTPHVEVATPLVPVEDGEL